jgi:eukaryotic-like serine/threonine-protein kinase
VMGGGAAKRELVWVTRAGVVSPLDVEPSNHRWPRLSPDGMRLAVGRTVPGATGIEERIWVIDLSTNGRRALTGMTEPVWMPDGRRVIASLNGRPFGGFSEQVADGSRTADTLFKSAATEDAWPTDVSRDGGTIVFYGSGPDSTSRGLSQDAGDISFLDRRTKERRRLRLPGTQTGGRLSPDGRWLAYQSVVDGHSSVHVRPYPALDADFLVSSGEGAIPVWSRDGHELFYRQGRDMMVVPVRPEGDAFGTPVPRVLFTGTFVRDPYGDQDYDVSPDGRFLMMQPTALAESNFTVHVIVNWLTDVRARLDRAK